ncbi:MAG: diacylglycerol O-acyltransferase [Hyphomicrobiaceae bacterium]|jgi:diacylglycerol O-acyltransferase
MQRLSGMDAAFLYTETPTAHMHVVGTMILDPSTMPGGYSFEALRDRFLARVLSIDIFRQRLLQVPFGLDHPRWVDDPTIDPTEQVRRVGVPAPGGMREFGEQVSWIAGQHLDRERPLWEIWVLEGLEGGRVGIVFKVHHCMVDGSSGAATMNRLFDLTPEGNDFTPASSESHEPVPTLLGLLGTSAVAAVKRPVEVARTLFETATSAIPALVRAVAGNDAGPGATMPFTTPRTSLSAALSSRREVAFGRANFEDAKRVKTEFGVTINDVVLAACTQSLRRWLDARGELPDRPIVASVPVNIRPKDDAGDLGNRVSVMFVALPVHLGERVAQLRFIHEDAARSKRMHAEAGPSMISRWAGVAPPYLMTAAAQMYSSLHLADHHQPVHSLVISNVAGPTCDLFAAGARVDAIYPLGPVMEGAALNMTVFSNRGSLDLGVVACPRTVSDVGDIAEGFTTALSELVELADVARSRRRKGSAKSSAKISVVKPQAGSGRVSAA